MSLITKNGFHPLKRLAKILHPQKQRNKSRFTQGRGDKPKKAEDKEAARPPCCQCQGLKCGIIVKCWDFT